MISNDIDSLEQIARSATKKGQPPTAPEPCTTCEAARQRSETWTSESSGRLNPADEINARGITADQTTSTTQISECFYCTLRATTELNDKLGLGRHVDPVRVTIDAELDQAGFTAIQSIIDCVNNNRDFLLISNPDLLLSIKNFAALHDASPCVSGQVLDTPVDPALIIPGVKSDE